LAVYLKFPETGPATPYRTGLGLIKMVETFCEVSRSGSHEDDCLDDHTERFDQAGGEVPIKSLWKSFEKRGDCDCRSKQSREMPPGTTVKQSTQSCQLMHPPPFSQIATTAGGAAQPSRSAQCPGIVIASKLFSSAKTDHPRVDTSMFREAVCAPGNSGRSL
jgi:hypothetical protein